MPPFDKAIFDLTPEEQSDEALDEVLLMLDTRIRSIQTFLGNRNRTDANGNRLSLTEWNRQRQRALCALNPSIEFYQRCKRVRKARNAAKYARQYSRAQTDDGTEAGAGRKAN